MRNVVALVCLALWTSFAVAAFDGHPFIRCEACLAVANVIGSKMNETAKLRSSFKAGHRLDPNNKVKMQDYESSELRAVEIMDSACDALNDWKLQQNGGVRVIRKGNPDHTKHPKFYGPRDRDGLDNFEKRLKNFCLKVLDDHDEDVVVAIKHQRDLEGLSNAICIKSSGHCEPAVLRKGELDERKRWDKSEAKRLQEEAAQAAAEAKAKAEEESRKATEDAVKAAVESALPPKATDSDVKPEL